MIYNQMFMGSYLFTSESVAEGHPDKVADQISDAILDACLQGDRQAKVAAEVLVTQGLVFLAGEITTTARPDFAAIVRDTVREIGYDDPKLGFDFRSCAIISSINKQSPDIAMGVNPATNASHRLGAGDQGIMFGFACDETPELMPLPIMLAHRIVLQLRDKRKSGQLPYLRPDAKAQVTIEYGDRHVPKRIDTIVISTQHDESVSIEQLHQDMKKLATELAPEGFVDADTKFYINPTGRFIIGGPAGDTGLTGRKIIIDTYGGTGRHGGGSFSGKDPTKVDRSAAYAARYAAKNVVAAELASRCELQLSYAIGVPDPVAINLNTFGTGVIDEEDLAKRVARTFDFSLEGIIRMLDLYRPIYKKTAFGGHFGRNDPAFTWENTDKTQDLLNA